MADNTNNTANEATSSIIGTLRETNQAIMQSAIAAQERNMAFAQSTFENGIEVLKSQAENSRTLMHDLVEQAGKQVQPEVFQAVVEKTIEAQDRNIKYAQSIFENGIEVLKSQVSNSRNLMQELGQQAQKQQDTFQQVAKDSVEAYMNFFRAPFTYYQQMLDASEAATREGLETFRNVARQGIENMQNVTRSAQQASEQAVRQAQQAQKATKNTVNEQQ
jgi:hypothetical protein